VTVTLISGYCYIDFQLLLKWFPVTIILIWSDCYIDFGLLLHHVLLRLFEVCSVKRRRRRKGELKTRVDRVSYCVEKISVSMRVFLDEWNEEQSTLYATYTRRISMG
jgi:hypothetical protein